MAAQEVTNKSKNPPALRATPLIRGARPRSFAFAGVGGEVLLEFIRFTFVRVRVGGCRALPGDVGPLHRELGIHLQPLLSLAVGVGNDRVGRTLGLAYPAVDALVGMDDQHVVALVEAVDRADLHAVHVFALDAVFGDDVGHRDSSFVSAERSFSGANYRT